MNGRHTQSGNALFIILIAVALLGALSYAVTQSNRGGVTALTDEKAKLYATEILDYAQVVSNAVAQLRLRGCDESEISFENNVVSGYANANSPSDKTCHVFHPSGGGLAFGKAFNDNYYHFSGDRFIFDVGTTGSVTSERAELYVDLIVDEQICTVINDKIDIENPSGNLPIGLPGSGRFTGTYNGGNPITHPSNPDSLSATRGRKSFCVESSVNPDIHYFVRVLIAR